MQNFSYAANKLSAARRGLMLPHAQGEKASVAYSLQECMKALMDLEEKDLSGLDASAADDLERLRELVATTGLEDPESAGLLAVRAGTLTTYDLEELSRVVDSLASYFGSI